MRTHTPPSLRMFIEYASKNILKESLEGGGKLCNLYEPTRLITIKNDLQFN